MMNKSVIYLAARYSRREELNRYADDLINSGHLISSRWLAGSHQVSDAALADDHGSQGFEDAERCRFALEDYADLLDADIVISFTEIPRTQSTRGGRHVEFGIAFALGKRCIIVGPRENVFHCLPEVERFEDWQSCLDALEVITHAKPY